VRDLRHTLLSLALTFNEFETQFLLESVDISSALRVRPDDAALVFKNDEVTFLADACIK
jgi:hypothetical protein